MQYCPHCMQPAGAGGFCAYCGKSLNHAPAAGQLYVGTLLYASSGHTYQLGAALGQGGFGITYAAKDLNTSERVAIKEYYPSHCAVRSQTSRLQPMTGQGESYDKGMKGFLEEARMLASVGNLPSVVKVLDYFEANGTAYLVMEYVEGSSLSNYLRTKGKLPAKTLFPMLSPLLDDLEILHRAGVIHRDISPDNLILTPNGQLKLLDFGSARSTQGDKTMTMLLKAGFSPVEQYQSHGQGPWTDVYALCATVYYCLTGSIPPISVDRLTSDTIVSPNALGAGLTQSQDRALMHGLQVLKAQRCAGMMQLKQELFEPAAASMHQAQVPATQPVSQYHGYQPEPPAKKSGRKGLLIALISFLVLLLIGLVAVFVLQRSENQKNGNAGNCRHKETETDYRSNKDGTHDVLVICSDPDCEDVVKESVADCEDEDDNGRCDDCRASMEESADRDAAVEQTADGILYVMSGDGKTCGIVGYAGETDTLILPATIEGAETVLREGAFADNSRIKVLDVHCKTIETGAFSNCSSLLTLIFWEECTVEKNAVVDCAALSRVSFEESCEVDKAAFSGCSGLRAASYKTSDPFAGCSMPEDFHSYKLGMDMGWGDIFGITVKDNVIYGYNGEFEFVALDLPDDSAAVELDEATVWVYEDALDGCSEEMQIFVGDNTAYPYELYLEADWDAGEFNTFSSAWYYSCYSCLYTEYETGVEMRPDVDLVRANMVRAQELARSDSFERPDGSEWGTVLDEYNVAWSYATSQKNSIEASDDSSDIVAMIDAFAADCGSSIEDGDYAGQYYKKAAAMIHYENDMFYFHGIMVLP